jgi:hypothetical protein
MKRDEIEKIVNEYKQEIKVDHRYASFDYCYNYFKTTDNIEIDIEKSCLVLGFYLASWGMFRKSFLLQKNAYFFEDTILYISKLKRDSLDVWNIDVDKYTKENIDKIIEIYKEIQKCLRLDTEEHIHLTLITKILLGVFGFIPAYDSNFCYTFSHLEEDDEKYRIKIVSSYSDTFYDKLKKSLNTIKTFYDDNSDIINEQKIYTIDFKTGEKTEILYPKAKIIDMYGFAKGLKKTIRE